MSTKSPVHESLWQATAPTAPGYPAARDCTVDVVVVGAGMAGLTTAYQLKKAGKTVAVVEMGRIGSGQTGFTTAHLTWMLDQSIHELREDFGEGARTILDAHASAIDAIERIARTEGIHCDFERVDAWRFGLDAKDRHELERDVEAAHAIGRTCEYVEPGGVPVKAPGGAMRVPNQGLFHPLKYLTALAQTIPGAGSHIFEDSKVIRASGEEGRWSVETADATVIATHMVVATNSPFGLVPQLQTRIEPYQTYAFSARIPRGAIPTGLYWDCEEPYQYLRVQHADGNEDLAILGGADHKTGEKDDTRKPHIDLERYLVSTLGVTSFTVTHRWSGQVLEPVDGVAYIGRFPGLVSNRWVATGFSGNGMTYGTIAGLLLSDLILDRQNEWERVFRPGRSKPIASAKEFVKANADVAYQMVSGRLARPDCVSIDEVPLGEGRMVLVKGRKLAVFRDDDGAVTAMSPVCTHMRCIVGWNAEEKTWDCPCHGSRFGATGEVMTGPATAALKVFPLGPEGSEEPRDTQPDFGEPHPARFR